MGLIRSRPRSGRGIARSVYFKKEYADMLTHLDILVVQKKIKSVSDFITDAVAEKYNNEIVPTVKEGK